MNKILAGVQAGVITLIFILLVAFMSISWVTVGWTILVAGLAILASFVFTAGNPIAIAISIVIIGLICTGIFFVSGLKTLAISLVAGIILGASWSITISRSLPRGRGIF